MTQGQIGGDGEDGGGEKIILDPPEEIGNDWPAVVREVAPPPQPGGLERRVSAWDGVFDVARPPPAD